MGSGLGSPLPHQDLTLVSEALCRTFAQAMPVNSCVCSPAAACAACSAARRCGSGSITGIDALLALELPINNICRLLIPINNIYRLLIPINNICRLLIGIPTQQELIEEAQGMGIPRSALSVLVCLYSCVVTRVSVLVCRYSCVDAASVSMYIFLTIHARASGMRFWSNSQPSSSLAVKERAISYVDGVAGSTPSM